MAKVGIISLGCPRNLVDSEIILGRLKGKGDQIVDIDKAEVAIVNTCAFIDDAKTESVETILELAGLKKEGKIKRIIVAGCLAQRYKDKLPKEFEEVDGFIGVGDLFRIKAVLEEVLTGKRSFQVSERADFNQNYALPKLSLTPPHYRYIKIQEGCGNNCSFCVIPQIKGPLKSRPIESTIEEISALPPEVSEINIVGQDITTYGLDLYNEFKLAELLSKIIELKKIKWIRLLYSHPEHLGDKLIKIIKTEPSVCKYLDLPLQHINDKILKRMNRDATRAEIISLIERLRTEIPDLAIRTTFIVGFPGEREKDFKELINFIKEVKFERLGVFTYSKEEGTTAAGFREQIPESIKQARYDEIMRVQQTISAEINASFLGRELEVLIDELPGSEPGWILGRTEYDAPEVDGQVWVKSSTASPGDFIKVKITDTLEYDLVGEKA